MIRVCVAVCDHWWVQSFQVTRFSTAVKAAALVVSFCNPAFAFGLSDTDYDYLATQGVPRDSAVLRGLRPKEQASLHAIIGYRASEFLPDLRAKNVADVLKVFQEHQDWEQAISWSALGLAQAVNRLCGFLTKRRTNSPHDTYSVDVRGGGENCLKGRKNFATRLLSVRE